MSDIPPERLSQQEREFLSEHLGGFASPVRDTHTDAFWMIEQPSESGRGPWWWTGGLLGSLAKLDEESTPCITSDVRQAVYFSTREAAMAVLGSWFNPGKFIVTEHLWMRAPVRDPASPDEIHVPPIVSKAWCLEMALREGELDNAERAPFAPRPGRHDYLFHESIEALIRCTECGQQILMAVRGAALPAPEPPPPTPAQRGKRAWCLEQIVAVMCERGLALDVLVSEIQDFLSMAGYDVPLRAYAVESGAALPAEHAPPDWRALAELLILWSDLDDTAPELFEGDVEWANALAKWLTSRGASVGSRPALAGSPDAMRAAWDYHLAHHGIPDATCAICVGLSGDPETKSNGGAHGLTIG